MDHYLPLLLVVSGSMCIAIRFVLTAKYLQSEALGSSTFKRSLLLQGSTSLLAGSAIALGILLFKDYPLHEFHAGFGPFLLIAISCHLVSQFLLFEALRQTDVASVSSFASVSPLVTILVAWLAFGERPSSMGILGIMTVVSGVLGMHLPALHSMSVETSDAKRPPWRRNGVILAFLSSIIPSFGQTAAKGVILQSNVFVYQSLTLIATGVITLAALVLVSGRAVPRCAKLLPTLPLLVGLSGLLILGGVLVSTALTKTQVANVAGMSRISIVFQILLVYFLADQREDIGQRLFWGSWIFVGVLCIARG